MDELEFDPYVQPTPKSYAENPVASSSLALLYGSERGNYAEVSQQTATMGPAYVASEKAKLTRTDNMLLLKEATLSLAKQGNSLAVEQALKEINSVEVKPPPTFVDDVSVSSEAEIERLMITSGKSRDEVINMAKIYSNNYTIRVAFETAIQGLEQRSGAAQFTQDVVGMTTVEDWGQLSPTVNVELEKLGFQGARALTFATSVSNFVDTLRIISPEDRGKVILLMSERLTSVVGEKDARRFLEAANSTLGSDAELEAIFGVMDVFTVAAFLKGSLKATMKATSAVNIGRKVGTSNGVAIDLANKITDGSSVLGASKVDAMDAAITSKALIPKETDGLAATIQKDLSKRVETALADLESSLYTGGANRDELLASKARLERLYTTESNPTIIRSDVNANTTTGKLSIDVLYGDNAGMPFATEAEALAYHKNWLRGNVEVVPANGTIADIAAESAAADSVIFKALETIDKAPYKPTLSTTGNLGELADTSPLFKYPDTGRIATKYRVSAQAAKQLNNPTVATVWATVRDTASKMEQLVMDKIIKSLPAETKVVIKAGDGRAYYMPSTDTVVMYRGNKDSNVFTHEIIHSVTSNKLCAFDISELSPLAVANFKCCSAILFAFPN